MKFSRKRGKKKEMTFYTRKSTKFPTFLHIFGVEKIIKLARRKYTQLKIFMLGIWWCNKGNHHHAFGVPSTPSFVFSTTISPPTPTRHTPLALHCIALHCMASFMRPDSHQNCEPKKKKFEKIGHIKKIWVTCPPTNVIA